MKLRIQATFLMALLLLISGCSLKPIPKKEPIVDETLPTVKLTKMGTIADINNIALEWESIEDKRVKGLYIYRVALDEKSSGTNEYFDTVNSRYATHYLDTKVKPSSKYAYYFKTYSDEAESIPSKSTMITSLDVIDSVSWLHSIGNMPRSAKVLWRPHGNQKVKAYLIQRRTLKDDVWTNLATVNGRLSAEYIDTKLNDSFTYIYRIRALTYDDITSKPSKEVTSITKALPKDIQNLSASTNLPKRIEIKWEKTKTNDFLKYNIYRASNIDGSYKLLVSLTDNFYVDNIEDDSKQYFYRVSAVDKDGLESMHNRNSVMGATLVKPKTPSLVDAKLVDGKVKISWTKPGPRASSYMVQKRYRKSLLDESIEDFENIKGLKFIDSEIEVDKVYYYRVFSVDVNGLKSEPSIEVEIKVAKKLGSENAPKKIQKIVNVEAGSNNKDVVTPLQDFN